MAESVLALRRRKPYSCGMSSNQMKPHRTQFSWADGRYAIIANKQRGTLPEDPVLRKIAEKFGSIVILRKR